MRFNPLKGLTRKQKEILSDIHRSGAKYSAIRASRQAGKTVLLEHATVMLACFKSNQIGAFISPSHSQSGKVFKSLKKKIPKQLIRKTVSSNDDRHILLVNGTEIQFKSSENYDLIRGNSYDFVILDEFAFQRREAWETVIKQTIAAKKKARVIAASTPLGRNLFYEWCINGMDEKNTRYKHYYFHYSHNPYYDVEEVEQAKKELPEAIFNQEYLAQFIFGNSVVFGDFSKFQTVKKWQEPKEGEAYYYGIDWSGTGEDSTVLTVMNQSGKVVLIKEIAAGRLKAQAQEVFEIIDKYKAVGYSEINGLGLGATEELEDLTDSVFRFTTTNEKKQEIVKDLNLSFSDNAIELPTAELCSQLDNQMATYEAKRTATGKLAYSHAKGVHDDFVDSLLLANHARMKLEGAANSSMDYDLEEIDLTEIDIDF